MWIKWCGDDPERELAGLERRLAQATVMTIEFDRDGGAGKELAWSELERIITSRAVTVAVVSSTVDGADRDVALCCDLVYLRPEAQIVLPAGSVVPSAGLVWALGRAGARAMWRGLTADGQLSAHEVVELGLASGVVARGESLPLPEAGSLSGLMAIRDLLRSRSASRAGLALESATFRLLFAIGDPIEGASAFLEGRSPEFGALHE